MTPFDVVRAAYAPHASEKSWLAGVLRACAPSLDHGLGVYAHVFDWERMIPESLVAHNPLPGFESMFDAWTRGLGPELLRMSCRFNCTTLSAVHATMPPDVRQRAEAPLSAKNPEVRDNFGLLGVDPGARSLCITVPLPAPQTIPPRERRRWLRVAAHLAGGTRLRAHQAHAARSLDEASAILTPAGHTVHAIPELTPLSQRERLRRAVVAIDRAHRLAHAGDHDDAIALWRALVDGTYTLVDHHDSDGRRYFLARKNPPDPPGPSPLTMRERQVVSRVALGASNKLIAYELGLSTTTVATHLGRAMRKLGVTSRMMLIQQVAEGP